MLTEILDSPDLTCVPAFFFPFAILLVSFALFFAILYALSRSFREGCAGASSPAAAFGGGLACTHKHV